MEWLIQATLQAELHEDVDLGRLYHEYRRFAGGKTAEKQLITLSEYAGYYKKLVSGVGDSPIARFGRQIAVHEVTTLYPVALTIAASKLTEAEKTEMYGDLVSYLFRRSICGLTTKSYNLSVMRQLRTAGVTPTALRASLRASNADSSRWPDDAEFRNACLTAALYPGRLDAPKAKMLMAEPERGRRDAVRPEELFIGGLDQLDVDHVLLRLLHR